VNKNIYRYVFNKEVGKCIQGGRETLSILEKLQVFPCENLLTFRYFISSTLIEGNRDDVHFVHRFSQRADTQ